MNNLVTWLKGLFAAAISAGSGSLAGLALNVSVHDVEKMAGVSAVIGAAMYLKKSPLPCDCCEEPK